VTIRWTQPANDDFLGIVEWIAVNNPAAASAVGRKILAAVEQLDDFPFLGRPGRSRVWREMMSEIARIAAQTRWKSKPSPRRPKGAFSYSLAPAHI
jgi:plasmid stabilization system protein ParE